MTVEAALVSSVSLFFVLSKQPFLSVIIVLPVCLFVDLTMYCRFYHDFIITLLYAHLAPGIVKIKFRAKSHVTLVNNN